VKSCNVSFWHSDALRQRSTSVAFGAKRTLTKPRCRAGLRKPPAADAQARRGTLEEKGLARRAVRQQRARQMAGVVSRHGHSRFVRALAALW
jgi:hypothetical protein